MRVGSRHCRLKLKHFLPFRTLSAHCDVSALFSSRCQCLMILPALVGYVHRKSKLDHQIGFLDNLAWGLFDTSSIGYWVHHFILKSGISIYILLQKRTRLEEEKITNDGGCILYSV